MSPYRLSASALSLLALTIPASAGSHSNSGGSRCEVGRPGVPALGAVSGGWALYPFPYYASIGPDGVPTAFVPGRLAIIPGGMYPLAAPPAPPAPFGNGVGVAGPWPPPEQALPRPVIEVPKAKKADPTRAAQLLTFGDRLFRAGNQRRAAERFEQAARADPHAAAPHVRLAQVALVRGQFAEAAQRFREAQTAEPGWLEKAGDIQTIYAEPGDFAKQIAKLESHLQVEPNDRDAWLVLGAQWYLSGRTAKAADVFLRLTDRRADATLAAFLDASTPAERRR